MPYALSAASSHQQPGILYEDFAKTARRAQFCKSCLSGQGEYFRQEDRAHLGFQRKTDLRPSAPQDAGKHSKELCNVFQAVPSPGVCKAPGGSEASATDELEHVSQVPTAVSPQSLLRNLRLVFDRRPPSQCPKALDGPRTGLRDGKTRTRSRI